MQLIHRTLLFMTGSAGTRNTLWQGSMGEGTLSAEAKAATVLGVTQATFPEHGLMDGLNCSARLD